jgi:hypothetical protein
MSAAFRLVRKRRGRRCTRRYARISRCPGNTSCSAAFRLAMPTSSQPINQPRHRARSFEEIAEMRGFTEDARGAEEILAV